MNKRLFSKSFDSKGLRSGISLLEVIIATVVLSVSAVMLVSIIGTADRNATRADERLRGQLICQNKLEELQAGMLPLESSDLQPTAYYPDWQYTINVEEWSNDSAILDGRLVVVEIEAYFRPAQDGPSENLDREAFEQRPAYILRRLLRKPDSESLEPGSGRLGDWE